jgi:hypothetical protein
MGLRLLVKVGIYGEGLSLVRLYPSSKKEPMSELSVMDCSQKNAAGRMFPKHSTADDVCHAKHEQTQPRRPRTGVVGNARADDGVSARDSA